MLSRTLKIEIHVQACICICLRKLGRPLIVADFQLTGIDRKRCGQPILWKIGNLVGWIRDVLVG